MKHTSDTSGLGDVQWKWKSDSGDFEIYEPDISNVLEALRIGEVTTVMDQYSIRKISNDGAVQVKLSTGHKRDVRRFKPRKKVIKKESRRSEDDLYLAQDEWM